jgi:hypothetical protein
MIDFRYHLVSIIAVFLALAVGIVVGTAALNGPIVDNLRDNISRLTSDKRALEGDVRELQAQVQASDEFATEVAPQLVEGALAEQRVLLVTTPDTPGDLAERLRPLLADAGAVVTGQLEVLPAFSDPQQRALIDDLVAQVVPAGVDLPDGGPVERAAAELAAALTTGPGNDPVDAGEAQAVVSAFEEADLVRFAAEAGAEGQALRTATLVVLLAPQGPQPPIDETVAQRNETLLALASALDEPSAGLVLAGPASSALEGGLVQALRSSATLAADLSSVDNADRGIGRLAVVLALDAQAEGEVGQYGAGPGASDPLPALPTP